MDEKAAWRLRHSLAVAGVLAIAASPLAALLTESRWGVWAVFVGVGGILLGVAAMMVPDEE